MEPLEFYPPVIVTQSMYITNTFSYQVNLNLQQPNLLSYCKKQNIAVMSYTPFGSLFYDKASSDAPPPRVDDPALVSIASKYNKTVPQITLRYLVSRPELCNFIWTTSTLRH